MAEIPNDSGALRLALVLVQRETGVDAAAARLLATAGLEYRDQRDGEWWPILRLPAFYAEAASVDRLLGQVGELLRGAPQAVAWRPDDRAAFAVQFVPEPGGAVLEVGLDLGGFLADAAGVAPRRDAELALFRFRAGQAELVRFADALARELEVLRR